MSLMVLCLPSVAEMYSHNQFCGIATSIETQCRDVCVVWYDGPDASLPVGTFYRPCGQADHPIAPVAYPDCICHSVFG